MFFCCDSLFQKLPLCKTTILNEINLLKELKTRANTNDLDSFINLRTKNISTFNMSSI